MADFANHQFTEGTRLRYPIYDDRGLLLLGAGTVVTPQILALLHRRGIRLELRSTLEVVAGGVVGTKVPVSQQYLKIGRHPRCQVRPTSKSVSNFHCRIEKLPLSLFVEDMNSTNGTRVNGEKITGPTELHDGDVIQFGDFAVAVELFAELAGEGAEAREVAQLILADRDSEDAVPEAGATLVAMDEMAEEVQRELKKRGLS